MRTRIEQIFGIAACLAALALSAVAQSASGPAQRTPTMATRPVVVLTRQSLADLDQRLKPDNKVEELFGGAGIQLRVAVQHEKNKSGAAAELHDASDDVYYVLEGSATLTLGGKLDSPREETPGEWRAAKITGGKTVVINKGDLIVVPRGTPHMRSTAGQDFTMILIKIYADGLPAPQPAPTRTVQKP